MLILTNNFSWKLTHVFCILGHGGLAITAGIAYVQSMSTQGRLQTISRNVWHTSKPCASALGGGVMGTANNLPDMAVHTLPMICLLVVRYFAAAKRDNGHSYHETPLTSQFAIRAS
jgi:hypothetical protein